MGKDQENIFGNAEYYLMGGGNREREKKEIQHEIR